MSSSEDSNITERKDGLNQSEKGQSEDGVKNEAKIDVKGQIQMKSEEKDEIKSGAKGETKGDIKNEAKNAVKDQTKIKDEEKGELKIEVKGQSKNEAKGQAKNEAKSQTKDEAKAELRNESKGQNKNEAKGQAKGQVKGEGKGQAKAEGNAEVKNESKSETKVEVKGETSEVKGQTKSEASGELKSEVKNEGKVEIRCDPKLETKAETKLTVRPKSDSHAGTSSVGNLRFINDELRNHVTKLRNQLEAEKGNLKQAHRQKVLEIKNVREQEQKKALATIIELKKKFHEEKIREMENAKESLTQKFETEKSKAVKLKDTEMLKVKQELDVKEKMLNKLLAQSNANKGSSDTGKAKLLDELSELRSTKRQLEESLSQATVVEKHHSENLRKLCDSYESELVRVRRDSHLEIRQLVSSKRSFCLHSVNVSLFSLCLNK